jgi:unsaturated rhamnogalacturonyl hydrolase
MTQRLLNSLQMTVKLLLSFMLLALWSEQASAWDYEAVKRIESATVLPQQPDREVLVTRYGASPKASAAKNQKAINRAIAEMSKSGGGRVVIPAGTWRTGALHLQSHVNLVVSARMPR